MARLIRHEACDPIKIEPQEKAIYICACGLSQNFPYCDGSHSAARREQAGRLCVYDKTRTEVVEEREDADG